MAKHHKPVSGKTFHVSAHETTVNSGEFRIKPVFMILAPALLLAVILAVWLVPRAIGDLFVALGGGRDILAGHLGKPDNWSFATHGRVWIDQNWGTDLLFYLVQHSLGYQGLLWLKALLISLCALTVTLAVRRRGTPLVISALITATALLAAFVYIDLRPNLMTLIFAPLVLFILYGSTDKPHHIWWILPVILIWANLHGGFIFGLGMICLWAGCVMISYLARDGFLTSIKLHWQLIAGTIISIALGAVNPFGIMNLAIPLIMLKSAAWRRVSEWQPIWVKTDFGEIWEFIAFICLFILLLCLQLVWKTASPGKHNPATRTNKNAGTINAQSLFDWSFGVILILFAAFSRRLIPLAIISLTPVLALQFWKLVFKTRKQWLIPAFGIILLALTCILFGQDLRIYASDYPHLNPGTQFDRMNYINNSFPPKLVKFINENGLRGNVLSAWVWEGYMRWYCPQIKIFMGGRAQQVYDEATLNDYNDILSGKLSLELLQRYGVKMIAIPDIYDKIIKKTVFDGNWVVLFTDGRSFLLADSTWPATRELSSRILKGRIAFDDHATAVMSQAALMLSPAMHINRLEVIRGLSEGVKLQPWSWGYQQLSEILASDLEYAPQIADFFQKELPELEDKGIRNQDGEELIVSRMIIAMALTGYYNEQGLKDQAETTYESYVTASRLYKQMPGL